MNASGLYCSKNDKIDIFTPIICILCAFILYELTNSSGYFWGDAGEFIAVSKVLGIGHAYGHPLFWLMGRIILWLFSGDPAANLNHFTAVFSAITCGMIAVLIKNWVDPELHPLKRFVVVFTITGLYASASTVWTQSTFLEVYNFQSLFIILFIYFLNKYTFRDPDVRYLFMGAFFFGISITLGLYVALLIIFWILLIFWQRKNVSIFKWSHLTGALFFLFLGLTLWLYLPVRSATIPPLELHKISHISDFISYLLRKNYFIDDVAGKAAIFLSLSKTIHIFIRNLGVYGIGLFLFSIWIITFKKMNRDLMPYFIASIFLVLLFGILLPLSLNFRQMVDMDVYFLPVIILILPLLTVALDFLVKRVKKYFSLFFILPVLASAGINWQEINISKDKLPHHFLSYLEQNLPSGSNVTSVSDEVGHALFYFIFGMGNPFGYIDYRIAKKNQGNTENNAKMNITQFAEIGDNHLQTFVAEGNYQLGGVFLVHPKDSVAAGHLEQSFTHFFSPQKLELNRMNRLDRLSLARLWSRRGVYWFFRYRKEIEKGIQLPSLCEVSVASFYNAFLFDHFTLEGADHANNLAFALIQLNRLDEAEQYIHQSIQLNNRSFNAYKALYTVNMRKGAYQHALQDVLMLAKIKPGNREVWLTLVSLYNGLNEPEKAKRAQQKVTELDQMYKSNE